MSNEIFLLNGNADCVGRGVEACRANAHASPPEDIFTALKTFAPARRALAAKEEAKEGNILPALGSAGYMLINFKEDLRDLKEAKEQVKAWLKGEDYINRYGVKNYKDYQHTFSSIRGMVGLEDWVKKGLEQDKQWAKNLRALDITFAETKTGQELLNYMDVQPEGVQETSIKEVSKSSKPKYAYAYKYKSKGRLKILRNLTAKAMRRTTKLGVIILAGIEAPKVIKAMTNGETATEQTVNTLRQALNSTVKITSLTAGIAYGGALGWQVGGPFGSLTGMGVGAVLGSSVAKKVKEVI